MKSVTHGGGRTRLAGVGGEMAFGLESHLSGVLLVLCSSSERSAHLLYDGAKRHPRFFCYFENKEEIFHEFYLGLGLG